VWGSEFTTKAAILHGGKSEFVPSFCVCGSWPSCCPRPRFGPRGIGRGAQAVVRGGTRCASEILDRGAQADARGTGQVLDRGAQAVARGAARCASQVLDRGAQAVARAAARCASRVLDRCARPLPTAPLVVRCRYLIVVSKPLPAAALAVSQGFAHLSWCPDRCPRRRS
jgi:hypothetical protein